MKAQNITMDEKNPYDSLTSNGIVGNNSNRRNSNERKNSLVDPKFGNFRGAKQSVQENIKITEELPYVNV